MSNLVLFDLASMDRAIQTVLGLHESIELVYVVDGYRAELTSMDGDRVVCSATHEDPLKALWVCLQLAVATKESE